MIMTVNKYFDNLYYGPEQDLFNDIVQEVIQIHGSDILYICRDVEEFDELLREEKVSVFKTTYSIDAYVPNTGQNNTMQKLMSKFGFRFEENMEIYISALSWDQLGTAFAQPRNGDYIYIGNPEDTYSSFTNCMFMICDVVDGFPDTMHFGSIASWKLTISSINKSYSNIMDTNYTDINDYLNPTVEKDNKTTIKKPADDFTDINVVPASNPFTKFGTK